MKTVLVPSNSVLDNQVTYENGSGRIIGDRQKQTKGVQNEQISYDVFFRKLVYINENRKVIATASMTES
jgi:hypothetical protein